jgi:L-iditol 2-dehydrogenase
MKAAFLTGEKKFEIRQVPEPRCPEHGLIMQVKVCGICGSDVRRWIEGPPPGSGGVLAGHEASGVVVEIGVHHRKYRVGERLAVGPDIHCGRCWYCERGLYNLCDNLKLLGITPGYDGGFSEKMALDEDVLVNGICHPIPPGLSFQHAALSEPCTSVLACHEKTGTHLGDTIVIMGGGPIGCIHVAVAKARGARVVVSEPNETRRKLVESFDPDMVVDPAAPDFQDRILAFTGTIGADIVVCANPVAATQQQAVEIVRKGGTVVLFGGLAKKNPFTTLDSNRIHYGEIKVIGSFSYHPVFHELALDMLDRGVIRGDKLITKIFTFEQIQEGFHAASAGSALKIILTMP